MAYRRTAKVGYVTWTNELFCYLRNATRIRWLLHGFTDGSWVTTLDCTISQHIVLWTSLKRPSTVAMASRDCSETHSASDDCPTTPSRCLHCQLYVEYKRTADDYIYCVVGDRLMANVWYVELSHSTSVSMKRFHASCLFGSSLMFHVFDSMYTVSTKPTVNLHDSDVLQQRRNCDELSVPNAQRYRLDLNVIRVSPFSSRWMSLCSDCWMPCLLCKRSSYPQLPMNQMTNISLLMNVNSNSCYNWTPTILHSHKSWAWDLLDQALFTFTSGLMLMIVMRSYYNWCQRYNAPL
jgi:hypothetical protein